MKYILNRYRATDMHPCDPPIIKGNEQSTTKKGKPHKSPSKLENLYRAMSNTWF